MLELDDGSLPARVAGDHRVLRGAASRAADDRQDAARARPRAVARAHLRARRAERRRHDLPEHAARSWPGGIKQSADAADNARARLATNLKVLDDAIGSRPVRRRRAADDRRLHVARRARLRRVRRRAARPVVQERRALVRRLQEATERVGLIERRSAALATYADRDALRLAHLAFPQVAPVGVDVAHAHLPLLAHLDDAEVEPRLGFGEVGDLLRRAVQEDAFGVERRVEIELREDAGVQRTADEFVEDEAAIVGKRACSGRRCRSGRRW